MNKRYEQDGVISNVSRGLLLIAIGVVFILINFGILPWSFWSSAVDLWPLILIFLGIGLLFSKKVPFSAVLLVFLLVLVGCFLIGGGTSWLNQRDRFWNQTEFFDNHFSGVVHDSNFMGAGFLNNTDGINDHDVQAETKIDIGISSAAGSVNLDRTITSL